MNIKGCFNKASLNCLSFAWLVLINTLVQVLSLCSLINIQYYISPVQQIKCLRRNW
jgi:hypothetical protein